MQTQNENWRTKTTVRQLSRSNYYTRIGFLVRAQCAESPQLPYKSKRAHSCILFIVVQRNYIASLHQHSHIHMEFRCSYSLFHGKPVLDFSFFLVWTMFVYAQCQHYQGLQSCFTNHYSNCNTQLPRKKIEKTATQLGIQIHKTQLECLNIKVNT